ncbi:MAG: hypothetical protein D3914_08850 [Candidatus Electrothrix sp. LOE2]|nr:hypothetical protein [Candidatus Electrothrix sp. LOE2]
MMDDFRKLSNYKRRKMKPEDYLISDNEYNSFNKIRGQVNAILRDFEKQFRDSNFATSPEGMLVLGTTSMFAVQLIKISEAIKANDPEAIRSIAKENMTLIGSITKSSTAM